MYGCTDKMQKVYTKNGDSGYTIDFSGKKIAKDHPIIVIGGKIDALQSSIDGAMMYSNRKRKAVLEHIQRKLWQTSAEIAHCDRLCLIDPIKEKDVKQLEKEIDALGEAPKHFIRFQSWEAIIYNECRIRARELETQLVLQLRKRKLRPVVYQYINRLSSLFFMYAYKSR